MKAMVFRVWLFFPPAFNLLVNFGIAVTSPTLISLGIVLSVPVNASKFLGGWMVGGGECVCQYSVCFSIMCVSIWCVFQYGVCFNIVCVCVSIVCVSVWCVFQ